MLYFPKYWGIVRTYRIVALDWVIFFFQTYQVLVFELLHAEVTPHSEQTCGVYLRLAETIQHESRSVSTNTIFYFLQGFCRLCRTASLRYGNSLRNRSKRSSMLLGCTNRSFVVCWHRVTCCRTTIVLLTQTCGDSLRNRPKPPITLHRGTKHEVLLVFFFSLFVIVDVVVLFVMLVFGVAVLLLLPSSSSSSCFFC